MLGILDLFIIYNCLGLFISMIGFISMIFIMRKLDMSKELKRYSVSGYIFFIIPIVIGITNIFLYLNTFNLIVLIIGVSIILIEVLLRFYDKKKLKQIKNIKEKKDV